MSLSINVVPSAHRYADAILFCSVRRLDKILVGNLTGLNLLQTPSLERPK
jgi:hypothetical protein